MRTGIKRWVKTTVATAGAALMFGGLAVPSARADSNPGDKPVASAPAYTPTLTGPYRDFGVVNDVPTKDPWVKDTSGNYTNPDAKTAYKALILYVTGAMTSVWDHKRVYAFGTKEEPDWDRMFENADKPGEIPALVDMFKNGDERTKAIVLGTVIAAHDAVWKAAQKVRFDAAKVNNWFACPNYDAYQAATTPEKVAEGIKTIEKSPNPWQSDTGTLLGGIWATSNQILKRAAASNLGVVGSMAKRALEYGDYRKGVVVSILRQSNPEVLVANNSPQQPSPP